MGLTTLDSLFLVESFLIISWSECLDAQTPSDQFYSGGNSAASVSLWHHLIGEYYSSEQETLFVAAVLSGW